MSHRLVVFSRHPSHNTLRRAGVQLPVSTSLRLGSTTLGKSKYRVLLNPPAAVTISANKLLMKQKFNEAGITTPEWYVHRTGSQDFQLQGVTSGKTMFAYSEMPYPLVAKSLHGSRGTGNHLINTEAELKAWLPGKTLSNYIFEKFYSYPREYRLHVSALGCFYTCRKMLKSDTPADKRWFRNDSNSVWVLEDNPSFNKPSTWAEIEAQCVKALNTIGLDVAAFDVKVQSKDKNKFIIIESNSAPSFGDITLQKYVDEIPRIVKNKLNV